MELEVNAQFEPVHELLAHFDMADDSFGKTVGVPHSGRQAIPCRAGFPLPMMVCISRCLEKPLTRASG